MGRRPAAGQLGGRGGCLGALAWKRRCGRCDLGGWRGCGRARDGHQHRRETMKVEDEEAEGEAADELDEY